MILNKEDIKVGDWFWSGNHNYPQKIKTLSFASDLDKDLSRQEDSIIINERLIFSFRMKGFSGYPIFRKWTPQPNETCIFWNNGDTPLTIGKFIKTTKQGNFLCESKFSNELDSQIPFGNIAPVTFDLSVYGLEV